LKDMLTHPEHYIYSTDSSASNDQGPDYTSVKR